MWKNLILLLIASIYFSSCKNDTKFLSPAAQNDEIKYITEVIPKFHLTVETDSILSNKFRVKIKYNSLNKNVLKIIETPHKINKFLYREFESVLEVFNEDKLIFNEKITKQNFLNTNNKFWEKAILQSVEINQIATQQNEILVLNFLFFNPQTQNKKLYNLYIDKKGNYKTKPVS